MILPKLDYIRQARNRLGITQRRLAALSGVTTSMINQIESGRSKPSYATALNIFEALGKLEEKSSPRAGDICSKEIVNVQSVDPISKAAELMRTNGYSQVPVFDGNTVIGILTEERLTREMLVGDPKKVPGLRVAQIMESCPAIVDHNTPAKALITLIRFSKAILVSNGGSVTGIITTSDILKMME